MNNYKIMNGDEVIFSNLSRVDAIAKAKKTVHDKALIFLKVIAETVITVKKTQIIYDYKIV